MEALIAALPQRISASLLLGGAAGGPVFLHARADGFAERRTQDRHDYRLFFDLANKGNVLVTDWRIRVEIPRAFVQVAQGQSNIVTLEEDSANLPADEAKVYSGDRKSAVVLAAYFVDHATITAQVATVRNKTSVPVNSQIAKMDAVTATTMQIIVVQKENAAHEERTHAGDDAIREAEVG